MAIEDIRKVITRFGENEERVDTWANDRDEIGFFETNNIPAEEVETIPHFMRRFTTLLEYLLSEYYLESGVYNVRAGFRVSEPVPAGSVIKLPALYYPKRNTLFLSYGGAVCSPKFYGVTGVHQYEEMGESPNEPSDEIILYFDADPDILFDMWVVTSALGKNLDILDALRGQTEELRDQTQNYMLSAQEAAELAQRLLGDNLFETGVANTRMGWIAGTPVQSGGILTLPVPYYPKRNVLYLAINGSLCTPRGPMLEASGRFQYEEIGDDPAVGSNQVRVFFDIAIGDELDAFVVASAVGRNIEKIEGMKDEAVEAATRATLMLSRLGKRVQTNVTFPIKDGHTVAETYFFNPRTGLLFEEIKAIPLASAPGQQIPNSAFRGLYAKQEEVESIQDPREGHFADNEDTGTEWDFGHTPNPAFRGSFIDEVEINAIPNPVLGNVANNQETSTEWDFLTEGNPLYRGIFRNIAEINSISDPIVGQFADNETTETEWHFGTISNTMYRGSFPDTETIFALSAPTLGQFADNETTETEWSFSTIPNPIYRGSYADVVEIETIPDSQIGDIADNQADGREWVFAEKPILAYLGSFPNATEISAIADPIVGQFADNETTETEWHFGIRPNPIYRGSFFDQEQIETIPDSQIGDIADNQADGREWVFTAIPNPVYRGSYVDEDAINNLPISQFELGSIVDNEDTGTEWKLFGNIPNTFYRGVFTSLYAIDGIENPEIDQFADNQADGLEYHFDGVDWNAQGIIGTTPRKLYRWRNKNKPIGTTPHFLSVWRVTENPIGATLRAVEMWYDAGFVIGTTARTFTQWEATENPIGTTPHTVDRWYNSGFSIGTRPHTFDVWQDSGDFIGSRPHTFDVWRDSLRSFGWTDPVFFIWHDSGRTIGTTPRIITSIGNSGLMPFETLVQVNRNAQDIIDIQEQLEGFEGGTIGGDGKVRTVNQVSPDENKNVQLVHFVTKDEYSSLKDSKALIPGSRYIVMDGAIDENGLDDTKVAGLPVGFEALWPGINPPEGWLDESTDNGLLSRAVFPQLWAFAEESGNILTDADWLIEKMTNGTCGAFSSGNGVSTFRVPLLRRIFPRAADPATGLTVGTYQDDAIRNMTGQITVGWAALGTPTGVFKGSGTRDAMVTSATLTQSNWYATNEFDASKQVPTAEENRPVAIVRLPIIKAFDILINTSTIDVAELAATVASLRQLTDSLQIIGEIRLLSFRAIELPFGWHFCNGDLYPLSGAVGAALSALPANFKADWGIAVSGSNISIPKLFYTDGRGYFLRAVDGTTRLVGSVETDAIRNITGSFAYAGHVDKSGASGAFYKGGTSGSTTGNDNTGQGWVFDASRVVPTANENRPLNIGMTPAIYLGV